MGPILEANVSDNKVKTTKVNTKLNKESFKIPDSQANYRGGQVLKTKQFLDTLIE